jgi:hypothetical protein
METIFQIATKETENFRSMNLCIYNRNGNYWKKKTAGKLGINKIW